MPTDVEILLKARDEASGTLKQVQRQLDELEKLGRTSAAAIGKATGGGKDDLEGTRPLLRLFGLAAKLRIGVDAVTLSAHAMNGEWDKAAEVVKGLPLGIGAMAQSLELVLGIVTGVTSELAELDAQAKENAREGARKDAILAAKQAADAYGETLERNLKLATAATEAERTKLQIQFQLEDQLKRIADTAKVTFDQGEAGTQSDVARRVASANTQNAEMAAFRKLANEEAALDSQIREKEARGRGDELAADIERIKEKFRVEIAEAERANELLKAGKLAALRDIEIGEAAVEDAKRRIDADVKDRLGAVERFKADRKSEEGSLQRGGTSAFESRFLTRVPGANVDVVKNTGELVQATKQQKRRDEERNQLLSEIADSLTGGPLVVNF